MGYTNRIDASVETLMKQASQTATQYLREALEAVDAELGAGQARMNPELVGTYMKVCAIDFATSVITQTLQEGAGDIADGMTEAVLELLERS
jgi:hypothetical protein